LLKLEQLVDISAILVEELANHANPKSWGFSECSSVLNFSLQGERQARKDN